MSDDNNVIQFPKSKLSSPSNIQSQEDLLNQIVQYKTSFAEDISEILSGHVFGELARSGVNFEGQIDALFPSMTLVTESIQSLQLKSSGVYHPLQDFAQDVFSDEQEKDEQTVENLEEVVDSEISDIDNNGDE